MTFLFVTSDDHGELLSIPVVGALCVFWVFLWLAYHIAPSWRPTSQPEFDSEADRVAHVRLQFYLSKLSRMWIYTFIATVGGLLLFLPCLAAEVPLHEMLTTMGIPHQILFTMAVGHWSVNIWEDFQTRSFLGTVFLVGDKSSGNAALFPLNLMCDPAQAMLATYFVHHTFTVFAYLYCLVTHELGGLMVQGLLFEVPVMLILRREHAKAVIEPPAWLLNETSVNKHWCATYLAFILGRGPAEVLWIFSMFPSTYPGQLDDLLDPAGLIVYHILAVFFTSLNIRIMGLFFTWHAQDIEHATASSKKATGDDLSSGDLSKAVDADLNSPPGSGAEITPPHRLWQDEHANMVTAEEASTAAPTEVEVAADAPVAAVKMPEPMVEEAEPAAPVAQVGLVDVAGNDVDELRQSALVDETAPKEEAPAEPNTAPAESHTEERVAKDAVDAQASQAKEEQVIVPEDVIEDSPAPVKCGIFC